MLDHLRLKLSRQLTAPDTITTWNAEAVCVNNEVGGQDIEQLSMFSSSRLALEWLSPPPCSSAKTSLQSWDSPTRSRGGRGSPSMSPSSTTLTWVRLGRKLHKSMDFKVFTFTLTRYDFHIICVKDRITKKGMLHLVCRLNYPSKWPFRTKQETSMCRTVYISFA